MKFFPDSTTFLKIGGLSIRWYAVLILIGAFLAYIVSKNDVKKAKYIDVDGFFDDLFIYTLWVGIIGARVWFCLFNNFSYYFSNPINILKIYDGGLAIHGGVIFGALFAYFYCKKKNLSFLKVADCLLPNVLIGQAVGRWGNFINKECHGIEVSEDYFNGILSFLKDGMYINGHYYEPMFFYESMLCLLGFLVIHFYFKKRVENRGDLVWLYLMWYGLVRIFIESRRTDSLMIGPIKTAQLVSLVFMIVGMLGYLGVFKKFIKKKKPTIIFDMDGTLVDTDGAIIGAYKYLFEKFDKVENFTPELQVEVLGPAIRPMFKRLFPNYDVEMLVTEYHREQDRIRSLKNKAIPHSRTVLENLHRLGYDIGIVSSRNRESVLDIMKDFGFDAYIDDVFGCFETEKLKPDPEAIFKIIEKNKWNRDDVIVIGDSKSDIEAGKNYGAYTIGFLKNPERSEAVKSAEANVYVTDLIEILDIVKEDRYFTYNNR